MITNGGCRTSCDDTMPGPDETVLAVCSDGSALPVSRVMDTGVHTMVKPRIRSK